MSEEQENKAERLKILTSGLEFSKQIVKRVLWMFAIHVLTTLAVIIVRPDYGYNAVGLMNATIPLYAVVFAGYFGKAGIENYQKIKNSNDESL